MAVKVDPMTWFHNFKKNVATLIEEQQVGRYRVFSVVMTVDLYLKCVEALGHEPDNILGYKIEVDEIGSDGESYVTIAGYPIQ